MTDSELIKSYLADRDVPCPACGYNLRGVEGSKCPECGKGICLSIHPASWTITKLWLLRLGAIAIICYSGWQVWQAKIDYDGEGWTLGAAPLGLVVRYWASVLVELATTPACLWVLWRTLGAMKAKRVDRLESALFWYLVTVLSLEGMHAVFTLGERLFYW